MKKVLLTLSLISCVGAANAQCIGSDVMSTCYDDNGNEYTVTRYGNITDVQGYNSNTGSSWSQTSQTIGNTTYQDGIDSNGNSWNQTIQNIGNSTYYSGTDSNGNSFYKTCTTNYDGSRSCY
ncbi:hypothetical protein ACLSZC_04295 [Avibacterium avium]|uniref:hypothetical protein n=1 Tax=Avibacterium avium TaxID=751 RepID=UPI003BF7A44A